MRDAHHEHASRAPGSRAALAASALALLAACSKVSTTSTLPALAHPVEVVTFQGKPRKDWLVDRDARAWTRSVDLVLRGTCVRGVHSIRAMDRKEAVPVGEASPCRSDGTFEWAFKAPSDGEYRLWLQPRTRGGRDWGNAVPLDLVVDTTPPPAPVITTNSGNAFVTLTPVVSIQGTVSADTSRLRIAGDGAAVTFEGTRAFSHDVELESGQTMTLALTASDFVGNESEPASISVSHVPRLGLGQAVFSGADAPGAPRPSASGALRLRVITLGQPFSGIDRKASASSGYRISAGVQNISALPRN